MTEQHNTEETTEEPQLTNNWSPEPEEIADQDQEQATEDTPDEQPSDPLKAARREAAGYRRKLRDAEAERDALREQIDAQQWSIVAANLKGLKDVGPLKAAGHSLEAFLADDGTVDPAEVRRIETEFAEATGLRLETQRDRDARALGSMDAGNRGTHQPAPEISWSTAIKGV